LCESVADGNGGEGSRERIKAVLDSLVDRSLMIREGTSYLSLAIPVGDYQPGPEAWGRFQTFLRKRGEAIRQESFLSRVRLREIAADQMVSVEEVEATVEGPRKKADQGPCPGRFPDLTFPFRSSTGTRGSPCLSRGSSPGMQEPAREEVSGDWPARALK
jgi:hypothetical protein